MAESSLSVSARHTFFGRAEVLGMPAHHLHAADLGTEILTVGAPLELRVRGKEGDPGAWFMIKEYSDTIAHERLTPATAEQAVFFPWEEVSEGR